MADHKYPAILTKKDWLKKKGTIAKMAGKTGVGQAMDALEKSYKKINWKIFNPVDALPMDRKTHTKEGLAMVIKNAKAEFNSSVKSSVHPNLKALKKKVTDARNSFKASKTIPKKAAAHADAVLAAIKTMEDETKQDALVAELKAGVEQKLKDFAVRDKMYKDLKDKLVRYATELARASKTVTTASDFASPLWNDTIRGIGTVLPQFAKDWGLEAEHRQWRVFASENFKPKTDEEVAGKFNEIAPVLRKIVAKIPR